MKSFSAYLILIIPLIALSACSSEIFDGLLDDGEVRTALVRTPTPIFREGTDLIVIKTVNNREPTFLDDKVIVPIGIHSFEVSVELRHDDEKNPDRSYVTRANKTLQFRADAAKEYMIDAREDASGLWIWAREIETGIIVAGDAPK